MVLVGVEAVALVGVVVRRGDASVFCAVFVLSRGVCVLLGRAFFSFSPICSREPQLSQSVALADATAAGLALRAQS